MTAVVVTKAKIYFYLIYYKVPKTECRIFRLIHLRFKDLQKFNVVWKKVVDLLFQTEIVATLFGSGLGEGLCGILD